MAQSRFSSRHCDTMRPPKYSADALVELLQRQTVATMPQFMAALGTGSRRTAVRKLREIPHHTSYSHNGRFYVLAERPRFDAHGLWSYRRVRFSSRGSLLDTLAALVRQAPDGFRVAELDALLQVRTADALRRLAARGRVARRRRLGRYWYASADSRQRRRQRTAREALEQLEAAPPGNAPRHGDYAAALQAFKRTLDERQRRWFAGLESLRRGHGGDRRAAALLGMDPATVARGRRELAAGETPPGRVRRPGGGRKPLETKSLGSSRS